MDYSVFFFNFGFTKHFNDLEEALTYGKESGFECAVVDKDGNQVKVFKTIQNRVVTGLHLEQVERDYTENRLTFSEGCGSLPPRTESTLVIYKCNKDTERYFMNKKTNQNKDLEMPDYSVLSSYMDIPDEKIEKLFADMGIEIKLRNDNE